MDDPPSYAGLVIALVVLIALSAFFSGSETALMRVNRYRLKALAKKGHRGARFAEQLLKRPDRLIGLILLGNNLVNFSASSIATLLALRIGGEPAVAIAIGIFTLVVLIFAEVAPKTLAALHPHGFATKASFIYRPLMFVSYPLVWIVNTLANSVLWLFGVSPSQSSLHQLNREELRLAVSESGQDVPVRRQEMLLSVLDLQNVTVEDIMVPRADIIGIDLEDEWDEIVAELKNSQHTRLPVFRGDLDDTIGFLHLRKIVNQLATDTLDKEALEKELIPSYFVPEDTTLNRQLVNFQSARRRMGLVVDEYGDLQGMVTLDDLLEEIVGEFTTDPTPANESVHPDGNGGFLVSGSANIRALNRTMNWELPVDGPKTINGLIVEYLETIPAPGTGLKLAGYPIEIVQTRDNVVRTVRVRPDDRELQAVIDDDD